jgi:uncharacterized protein YndB with AHSA1/START domain
MAIQQLPSGNDELILAGDFLDFSPRRLFDYWTRPDLLTQWWPRQAEVRPGVGGGYVFSWPERQQTLRGSYTVFDPGRALTFTWQWDHEPPHIPPIAVALSFTPLHRTQGTALRLVQVPYADTPSDQETRNEHHLEGWTYFLAKLQRLSPAGDWTGSIDRELDDVD